MSLNAIGIPVSGPASPAFPFAPRRWSARRACAKATSRVFSGQMKAFSSPFNRAMRPRKASVSSTEETFLVSSAEASSARLALSTYVASLLDDLGHQIQVFLHERRDGLITLTLVGFGDGVGAQPLLGVQGMRHRFDARGIDSTHLVDQAQDPVQTLENRFGFVGPDSDAGEPGEPPHLVVD